MLNINVEPKERDRDANSRRNSIKHEFGVPKFVEPSGMNQARVPRPVDHKRK
jgi:hypothetical protein